MELQWNQSNCAYLRHDLWETQNLEQTQEVRLGDGMPDIGRVICAWGQPVLRSKEWRSDGITATCGVGAWILYVPEDGSEPKCMDVWLPFQAKWNLQESRREGTVRVSCCLRGIEARVRSSRKMVVRASLAVTAEVLEPTHQTIFTPGELPEDVQVLEKCYPALLPKEAGEKQFSLEEECVISGDKPQKILYCQAYPWVTEQSVIGSRAVFKGNCAFRLLYMTEAGQIRNHFQNFSYAQYADLDGDYENDAGLSVILSVTSLDTDMTENGIYIKCGLVGQYLVSDRSMIRVAEDAYSPYQEVTPVLDMAQLPMILDRTDHLMTLPEWLPSEAKEVVDAVFFPDQTVQFLENGNLVSQAGGQFQVLYIDMDGNLQSAIEYWSGEWSFPMAETCKAYVRLAGMCPNEMGDILLRLEAVTVSRQEIPMISGLSIGNRVQPDPNRPSLILMRAGERSLWELAKESGTTVASIQMTNGISGEPEKGRMLLIPIQ